MVNRIIVTILGFIAIAISITAVIYCGYELIVHWPTDNFYLFSMGLICWGLLLWSSRIGYLQIRRKNCEKEDLRFFGFRFLLIMFLFCLFVIGQMFTIVLSVLMFVEVNKRVKMNTNNV